MTLRPEPHPTLETPAVVPAGPEERYHYAVVDAVASLDRCYRNAADALATGPVPIADLDRWAALLTALSRCSDALCRLK